MLQQNKKEMEKGQTAFLLSQGPGTGTGISTKPNQTRPQDPNGSHLKQHRTAGRTEGMMNNERTSDWTSCTTVRLGVAMISLCNKPHIEKYSTLIQKCK